MKSHNKFFKKFLPPVLIRKFNRYFGGGIVFDDAGSAWDDAALLCTGYNADDILKKTLDATLTVKRGDALFERDSVLFYNVDFNWPGLSGLMWAAALAGGKLNVLDFGGALGSSYFQHLVILNTISNVRWNVVEQAHYVEAGRTHIQDDVLRFYYSIDECLIENKPNVIILSSVLQYLEFPFDVIRKLPFIGASILIIDRTPFSNTTQDRIFIQRVPPSIYNASYPMWVFSASAFMNIINQDWCSLGTIRCPEGTVYSNKGFEFSFQGMLLQLRES
ncbi:methyltransferase, TIGR04325 family [Methylomonas rosea]|uniref:Methyltransferase, TIGR04325 family n=1 Tax=Methylomonas rosea TaxID=2952227 RepID=A0ABT1TR78_9GAMM|nr:methyltransferase, TIGR04325 family [Methylomonas sp. WSC-7]